VRWIAVLLLLSPVIRGDDGIRVIFGIGDQASTKWDGSVKARGAEIKLVEPWRFEREDSINGSSWTASTHNVRAFVPLFYGLPRRPLPIVANGVILTVADTPDAEIAINTAQGTFDVRLRDVPYGKSIKALNGRVMIDRIPVAKQLTRSPEEEDYPATAVDKQGNVWIAYLEFKHNPDHNTLRANVKTPITDFSKLKAPTGGDQVWLRKLSGGDPIAITASGLDLYRPAIAVDGTGRVWVFWSQNERNNFDLRARSVSAGKPGPELRVTREPGSDVFPVATTDSSGKVWVAWQGWREGEAAIFAARQNGSTFTGPATVSSSSADEWNPAIAADASGRVTVAWDSYRNGNYDVYMRTATNESWGPETLVAGTRRYEAYPSIAYDPSGRLWVAYEEGAERWGKDFGAYDTTGMALYQGRAVRLVGFGKDGSSFTTKIDPGTAMPGIAAQQVESAGTQSADGDEWLKPNPDIGKNRRPGARRQGPKNTTPRLYVDASGRIWLAFRSAHPVWWNPVGTVWSEYVASYDGSAWTGPIFLAHSDNLLDNRPALVSTKAGELTVIGSADGRRQFYRAPLSLIAAVDEVTRSANEPPPVVPPSWDEADPFNNDLWANVISLGPVSSAPSVVATGKPSLAAPDPLDQEEEAAVARMRTYRESGLRIMRGEFHRHSEYSMDGGGDGTMLDQWRYILDTAALDWVGCCDHDNGNGREYTWWTTQKLTDIFYTPGKFVPMFSYERSLSYPEGHRNTIFAQRGIRVLPRLLLRPPDEPSVSSPDTRMLYAYLKYFDGIVASHTSGTVMGTDWRDNDPLLEPAVEIYQGDRQNYERPEAPRANSEKDSIGGWRPKGFVSLALEKGFKLGFEASSDHVSTHISYANLLVPEATRSVLLNALKKRNIYAATDNIVAEVRSGAHVMGDAFSSSTPPELQVKLEGTAPFTNVSIVRNDVYVYSNAPKSDQVKFTWRDMTPLSGKTSYYYVRGEQENGEIVWASPMWITYRGK
jgi:hypothetical protein